MIDRVHVITPSYAPSGGVIKLFDYVTHILDLGIQPVVHSPQPLDRDAPIFQIDRFSHLLGIVPFCRGLSFGVKDSERILFSWPPHYESFLHSLPKPIDTHVFHLVQGTRHANPHWLDGYGVRLLHRPAARIFVGKQVEESCKPFLNRDNPSALIPLGHDWPFFYRDRADTLGVPIRVGYMTWKSSLGDVVASKFEGDDRFRFVRMSGPTNWEDLRTFYHSIDILIATPGPEEGFFLPGLEAMAAGILVLVPNVGGNMEYTRFNANALEVEYEEPTSYVNRLEEIVSRDAADFVQTMRSEGYQTLLNHDLAHEKKLFGKFLQSLE